MCSVRDFTQYLNVAGYTDPKMQAYALALKMFRKKAIPKYNKYKPPFENVQCHVGPVCYIGGKPNYLVHGEKYNTYLLSSNLSTYGSSHISGKFSIEYTFDV